MNSKDYRLKNTEGENKADKLTKALLFIYLILLAWILLFKFGVRFSYMGKRSVNIVPFGQSTNSSGQFDLSEIILNIIIFLPLGIYAAVLFRRWTWSKRIFFIFLVSFCIEVLQYILRVGAFDITDIITNVSGGIIGLLVYGVIGKLFNSDDKSQKFINLLALIATLILITLLVLLKLNMLPIRYQ